MKKFILLAALFFFGLLVVSPAHAANMTRLEFAKLLGVKKIARPRDDVLLSEAAVLLAKKFKLDLEKPSAQDPWYRPYLYALEEKRALPVSFWTPSDRVARAEAADMIARLGEKDTSQDSLLFSDLADANVPYRSVEFLRLQGDFSKPVDGRMIPNKVIELFREPGTYNIFDMDYDDENAPNSSCRRYYTQSGKRGSVSVISEGDKISVRIEALSTDFCEFPYEDMEPGECPPDAVYGDDPRCNIGVPKPYTLVLEKRGKELTVRGAESGRIRITRAPIEPICREWAADCPAGYYEPTRVVTSGALSKKNAADGAAWNLYTTAWKPIFGDLRGLHYAAFDSAGMRIIYEAPEHNKDAWGHGSASFDACMGDPVGSSSSLGYDFNFCIKREGNSLVVASQMELGTSATFWIDTHYRR